ncbi:MAG: hypothetical protein OXC72_11380, partial [Roseovarius sp.]|nr:hypothetical protein [Roseovarius sp.]
LTGQGKPASNGKGNQAERRGKKNENAHTPPDFLLAAALAVTALAAPVWAQATITAPGLIGQPACLGTSEVDDPLSGSISAVGTNQATLQIDAVSNLYSSLRAQAGDGGPTEFTLQFKAYNARTNSQQGSIGTFATVNSGSPNLAASTQVPFGLSANTPYYVTVYTTASGFGEARPLMRRCFMTGGTYTPSNESGQPGFVANTTSGCFSISPRTYQDVRNCLCGRSDLSQTAVTHNPDTNTQGQPGHTHEQARGRLGCAN